MGSAVYVAVVGPADAPAEVEDQAEAVGAALASAGVDVAGSPEEAVRRALAAARQRVARQ